MGVKIMNNYTDINRLYLLRKIMGDYKSNILSVGDMADGVESIINSLEGVNSDHIEMMSRQWFAIEEVYAFALYRSEDGHDRHNEKTFLLDDEKEIVNRSIAIIDDIVSGILMNLE